MDQISIKGLSVYAYHGVLPSEQQLGQTFLIDCCFLVDSSLCDDNIEKTVHYGRVSTDIVTFCREQRFDLLETLANRLALHLLQRYPRMEEVRLTVHKPHAPIVATFSDVAVTATRGRHICYLGLGSNLGDREAFLRLAESELAADEYIEVLASSSCRETKPYGVTDQPDFLNAALKIRTLYDPQELLRVCQRIEAQAGRQRLRHWGERTLDIDILLYDDLICHREGLQLPHPEIGRRSFVLEPLIELDPYLIHPVARVDMQTLLARLRATAEGKGTV
ncbi:MAG: 2-amino-4-hydroxy-6-hydroxymethyldihydropteridine diphosphokinase [Lachnospiraceae bacterium]|nr:2-amino-4-hydroxy-6-hydroxymethyldihydropteridine diphosphokinase [Lachnospiraceae bacterium]MDY5742701.1 2-amino-4-hydroxy-6-hydroxymethyldihydropteridine diphosphokinase [Lachnospiraceae bacterium]